MKSNVLTFAKYLYCNALHGALRFLMGFESLTLVAVQVVLVKSSLPPTQHKQIARQKWKDLNFLTCKANG